MSAHLDQDRRRNGVAAEPARVADWASLAKLPQHSRRHYGRVAIGVVALIAAAFAVQSVIRNPAIDWHVVFSYLFSHEILSGVLITIELTAASMAIALALAVIIAIMRSVSNPVLRFLGFCYVWLFRSTPLLVLLLVTFNLGLFYRHFAIGVPFGPTFFSITAQNLINPFMAAVVAFSLHEAAYSSEIIRGSIKAVAQGQRDAALAIGMRDLQIYRRIILPQALRVAVPALANDTINMVKNTALVAFIAVSDLMYTAQSIYQANYQIVPLLMVACLWYLAIITALTLIQAGLERQYARRGIRLLTRRQVRGLEP